MSMRPVHRDPRHFSTDRLSTPARRRLRGLSLSVEDIRYVFTFGTRIRLRHRTAIVLRRRDFPPGALDVETIARREGIVLLLDHHGLIRDLWRDRDACRTFRSRHGELSARPRHRRVV